VIASKEYVSEAQYIVRGISSHHASGLESLFSTFGISRTADDTFAIQDYLRSRSAVEEIGRTLPLRTLFARPEADVLSRFPHAWRGDSDEMLYEYFRKAVQVQQDGKGVSTLKVVAFRPDDARNLARALILAAEHMVNGMNERAQRDTLANLNDNVHRSEEDLVAAQAQLTAFRNRELLVDPNEYSTKILDTVGQLSRDLADANSEISETEQVSPSSPRLPSLRAKAASLAGAIRDERQKLGGSDAGVATKVSVYDRLTLSRDLADKRLAADLNALEIGRQEARRQQIYIEEIAAPNLPDQSLEPQRFRTVVTVAVLGFAIFCMVWLLLASSKEHAQ
jgi:capsular polysaccharide transport system permease protein